jgi:glycerol transport system substrate-binding protein
VSLAVTGEQAPQGAMDKLAKEMDDVLARLERAGMKNCPPKLNPEKTAKEWLAADKAPHQKLANEKPKGETVPYKQLLQAWKEGRVK